MLFVATATAGDDEMRRRIEAHRRARPQTWQTLEIPEHVGRELAAGIGQARTVVVDCITLLVNNVFLRCGASLTDVSHMEKAVLAEMEELIDCMRRSEASFIIVTNEIGLGLVPADGASRLYRDLLGKANQALAASVDQVYLLVAGIPLAIKPAT